MILDKIVRNVIEGIIISGSIFISGCHLTGSDFLGVGLKTVSPYARNPLASELINDAGGLAQTNAKREHELRMAKANATNLNINLSSDKEIKQNYENLDIGFSSYNGESIKYRGITSEVNPERTSIVFQNFLEGDELNSEIFIFNLYGKHLKRLTFTKDEIEFSPIWSKDGKNIAYFSSDKKEGLYVKIIDIEGKNERVVKKIFGHEDKVKELKERIKRHRTDYTFSYSLRNFKLNWKTVGLEAIIQRPYTNIEIDTTKDIAIAHKDTLNKLVCDLSNYNPINDSDIKAKISPDGEELVFCKKLSDNNMDIIKSDAEGKNIRRLTFTPNKIEKEPYWSPDGNRIAYFEIDDKNKKINARIMNSNGSDNKIIKELEYKDSFDYGLSWKDNEEIEIIEK